MNVEDYTLALGQDNIPWRLFTPGGSSKEYCVLWLQGWSTSMDAHREGVERMVAKTAIPFATLDYAGHGRHAVPIEESTREQQHKETLAVFDELKNRGFKKIIVVGGSFGGYLTALLTAKRPVHAAVLRAPANYPDNELSKQHKDTLRFTDYAAYTKAKESGVDLTDSSAVKAIQNYDGFLYVLENELDDVVPAQIPRHYFEVAKHGNYIIIPATKHSPRAMPHPERHYAYIEHMVVSIIEAITLQDTLPKGQN